MSCHHRSDKCSESEFVRAIFSTLALFFTLELALSQLSAVSVDHST